MGICSLLAPAGEYDQTIHADADGYYRTLIGDLMLEVEPTGQQGRVTKPSPAPLHNHSPGGCTIDMSRIAAPYLVHCRQEC